MQLLRRPIRASDRILDIFYVISMEFLSLSRRRSSARNVPSGEERGETDVFAGYWDASSPSNIPSPNPVPPGELSCRLHYQKTFEQEKSFVLKEEGQ